MICPIDSLLAAMLTRIDLLAFGFASCGEYYGNGMEQEVRYLICPIDSLLAAMLM